MNIFLMKAYSKLNLMGRSENFPDRRAASLLNEPS